MGNLQQVGIELVTKGSKKAIDNLKGFNKEVGKIGSDTSGISNLDTAISGLVLAGGGLVALGLSATVLGIGTSAITASLDFDTATRDIQAQLGVTETEAESLSKVTEEIWSDNFFDDVREANDALIFAKQTFGEISDIELTNLIEDTKAITDAFDGDFNSNLSAVDTLMENFGLTSEEATDLLTAGFQDGLDRSGDLIETIEEYSGQFGTAGSSAEGFFETLKGGSGGGVLGVEKIADAFKELPLKFASGGEDLKEELDKIGLDFDDLTEKLATGELSQSDIFDEVIDALLSVDESVANSVIQSGQLGTQFEDLTLKGIQGFKDVGGEFDNVSGKADGLLVQYDTLGGAIEGLKRRSIIAIKPIGDSIVESIGGAITNIINENLPLFDEFFKGLKGFSDGFTAGLESDYIGLFGALTLGLSNAFGEDNPIVKIFSDNLLEIEGVVTTVKEAFGTFFTFLSDNIAPIATFFGVLSGTVLLSVLVPALTSAGLAVGAFALTFAPVVLAVGAITLAIFTLKTAWEEDWGGIQDITKTAINDTVIPAIKTIKNFFTDTLIPALGVLKGVFVDDVFPAIKEVVKDVFINVVIPTLTTLKDFISDVVIPVFTGLKTVFVETIFPAIGGIVKSTIETVIIPVLEALRDGIVNDVVPKFKEFKDFVSDDAMPAISTAISTFWENAKPIFDTVVSFVTDTFIPKFGELSTLFVENIFPAMFLAVDTFWSVTKVVFDLVVAFVTDVLIPTFKTFYTSWTEDWWPLIQMAVSDFWVAVEPILASVVDFFLETLIPTVKDLYEKWVVEWFPAISSSVSEMWEIVHPLFQEVVAFVLDVLFVAVEGLYLMARDEAFPAISTAVSTMWTLVKPIFDKIVEFATTSIPTAIDTLKTAFDTGFSAIKGFIDPVIGAVESLIGFIGDAIDKFKDLPSAGDVASGVGGAIADAVPRYDSQPTATNQDGGVDIPFTDKYADGVRNHKGGWGIVGEAGQELVATPDGGLFLTTGATLMDIPMGTDIYNNRELGNMTQGLMELANGKALSAKSGTQSIGNIDIQSGKDTFVNNFTQDSTSTLDDSAMSGVFRMVRDVASIVAKSSTQRYSETVVKVFPPDVIVNSPNSMASGIDFDSQQNEDISRNLINRMIDSFSPQPIGEIPVPDVSVFTELSNPITNSNTGTGIGKVFNLVKAMQDSAVQTPPIRIAPPAPTISNTRTSNSTVNNSTSNSVNVTVLDNGNGNQIAQRVESLLNRKYGRR